VKITYFYRNPQCGFSIQRVFKTLTEEIKKYAEVEEVYMPVKGSMPWDIIRNGIYAFRYRNKQGINHITGHVHDILLAFFKQKTVLTVHDLVFLDNVKNPVKKFYKWFFWLYLPVKLSDKIVCISTETKQRILRQIHTNRISVIYNSIDNSFKYSEKEFNNKKPVILHIGTGWNKNLKRTIEALKEISCHLRIIGKINNDILHLLEICQVDYSNLYNLTNEEIRQEYINCDIVNFPSEYEGFGMLIIEGQATGRVVVTSNIEPLIEISGGAVEFVNPNDVQSIRQAYINIINDKKRREKLIYDGLKNIERFSVNKIAKQYLELYKELNTS
jgi:glycosyltransferase involved in cell wall biosynthesis